MNMNLNNCGICENGAAARMCEKVENGQRGRGREEESRKSTREIMTIDYVTPFATRYYWRRRAYTVMGVVIHDTLGQEFSRTREYCYRLFTRNGCTLNFVCILCEYLWHSIVVGPNGTFETPKRNVVPPPPFVRQSLKMTQPEIYIKIFILNRK